MAGLHGVLAGALLTLLHALVLYVVDGALASPPEQLIVEALLAATLAAVFGALGGRYRLRRNA